jgi:DNA-binding response OmpR family regulator
MSAANASAANASGASALLAPALSPESACPPRASGLRSRLVRQAGEGAASGPSLRLYLASRMVLSDGVPVRLTRREYDLLVFLCQHPHRVFGRGQLMRQVWGYEMVSGERTVDVHVRRLRVKLGGCGPVIATVRGVGYRLDEATQVTVVSDPE